MCNVSIWFCPPLPPNPSSIPTNPTASNHYTALFRFRIVLNSSRLGPIEKEIWDLNETNWLLKFKKIIKQPPNHPICSPSSMHTVWGSSHQTVTDPYPVTQTALGSCLVGGMVQHKVSVCVCIQDKMVMVQLH